MDRRTLTALNASIKHWEENVAAEKPEDATFSPNDCALCRIFFEEIFCGNCPVAVRTGQGCCGGTPYYDAVDAHEDWQDCVGSRAAYREAARRELAFLKSLLPKPKP